MKRQTSQIKKGILFAFLTSIISGVAIFYAKLAVAKIEPLVLTTSRNLYVGLIFLLFFLVSKRLAEIKKLTRGQLIRLILIGIIGGGLPFFLFFTGLKMTSAQTANLIHKSLFIWVSALAVIFLNERFNLTYTISFILVFIANFLFTRLPLTFGKGELIILAATILWAIENVLAKKVLKEVSSEMVGLFRMGIGSSILLTSLIITGKSSQLLILTRQQLVIIVIGGSILFFYVYFWYKSLKYAPASLVTLILSFSLVVGNVLKGAFVGINIFPKEIYSSLLIVIASGLLLLKEPVVYKNKGRDG